MTIDQFRRHCALLDLPADMTDRMWAELQDYSPELDDLAIVMALIVTAQCVAKWDDVQAANKQARLN